MRIETPEQLQRAMGAEHALSPQQWTAASAPLGPAVVIAGAGSGKTTLMAARVVFLVLTGQLRPDQVLGLTFTTKAASQLRSKIHDALTAAGVLDDAADTGRGVPDDEVGDVLEPTVATYNAYAATLLADHGLRIGHEPDTRVVTDAARYQLGARVVDRYTGDISLLTDHPPTAIQNLLALDSAMSEHLVSPADIRRVDGEARIGFELARAAEVAGKARKGHREACERAINAIDRRGELLGLVGDYRRLKAELGLMDFSDQIELGARLARDEPDVGGLERDRFRVVLLDEYQDTSVAQAIMLSRLFSGPDVEHGLGHAVTAVGDPNQAIYGWRGASVSNILGFADSFPASDGTVPTYPLTVSYRSDVRILEVANRLAAPLYEDHAHVGALEPAGTAGVGTVGVAVYETRAAELDALVEAVRAAHVGSWADIGVLTRDNTHAADVFDALTDAGVPVEIVGLAGLLRLSEVAEIVAVLHLLHDVTANAALLTLLTGPRWAIGPRDLRLLGHRAQELAGRRGRASAPASVAEHLVQVVDGIDPSEIPALDDAIADPGDLAYSAEARDRFPLLAEELRGLRRHVGEPLLDVVRRIVDVTGADVELASAVSPAAAARRDNLDLFLKAVADFQAVDGEVTLPALLAYLTAEDEAGNALDVATPTEADSVKLLTVHRAKGLEWGSVFLVGVCETRFPSNRSRMLWVSSPAVLPAPLRGDAADQPQLRGFDKDALETYRADTRSHDAGEELRLAYVAFTRAERSLRVTSYQWGPRASAFGPSAFQRVVRAQLEAWGEPVTDWLDKPEKGTANPYAALDPAVPWPATGPGLETRLRLRAAELVRAADPDTVDEGLDMVEAARVAEWDDEIERLLAEARLDRADIVKVPVPASLSATAFARLQDDPDGFARELARPMPRPPSPAARFGTRFHAWVESRFGQQLLLDPDDLPGRGDTDIADDAQLLELIARFRAGPFADRVPVAIEAPFAVVLAGQVVRGRIDAVYDEPGGGFLVVDWKTGREQHTDPMQLALYRLAWAELRHVRIEQVRAVFYLVAEGGLVEPADLPDRSGLEALVGGFGGNDTAERGRLFNGRADVRSSPMATVDRRVVVVRTPEEDRPDPAGEAAPSGRARWSRFGLPLGIFAFTRVVDGLFIAHIARQQYAIGSDVGAHVVKPIPAHPGYLTALTNWDGQWYESIALHGYPEHLPRAADHVQQNTWAFYPVYPGLVRLLMEITRLPFAPVATGVSMIAGAAAVCLLFHMLVPTAGRFSAGLSVLALCTYPAAPLLQAAYTESLALLLLVACMYFLREQRYAALTLTALVLSLTRPIVLPVAAVIAVHALVRWRARRTREFPRRDRAWLGVSFVVAAGSLMLWPAVAGIVTGEPGAYFLTQQAWSVGLHGYTSWFGVLEHHPLSGIAGLIVVGFAVLAFVVLRRQARPWGSEWRAWALLYPAYLTVATRPYPSILRYAMLAVVPWWPAPTMATSLPRSARWLLVIGVAGLGLATQYLYVGWFMIPRVGSLSYP